VVDPNSPQLNPTKLQLETKMYIIPLSVSTQLKGLNDQTTPS